MKHLRNILVTNDDSVNSKGIKVLTQLMRDWGNVTVIAPKFPQSGKSMAITMDRPLRLELLHHEDGLTIYTLDGTPVDCVKMAMHRCYLDTPPDLIVSGINHGSNASIASIYSGTLGATAEGTIYGIPSIGFSIVDHDKDADFSAAEKYIPVIMEEFLEKINLPSGTYLNINFPKLPAEQIKGIRLGHQGDGRWVREFTDRVDPFGREYFWMTGEFINMESDPDTEGDHVLNHNGYISVVPHKLDNTDYRALEEFRKVGLFGL